MNCLSCDFYKIVNEDDGENFYLAETLGFDGFCDKYHHFVCEGDSCCKFGHGDGF